jgi:hypothetical protein
MLNNHPMVAIPLESLFIIDYLRAEGVIPLSRMKELMTREYEIAEWGIRIAVEDLDGCNNVKDLIDRIHTIYMKKLNKSIWGQKTPRFVRYGDLIKSVYPTAKFIHVIRDPRAVVNSLIRSNVHRSNVYYASQRWLRDVQAGLQLKEKFPQDVKQVLFEDLVTQPEDILLEICTFLGINFDGAVLNYYETTPSEYSTFYREIHSELANKPNTKRINAWRENLSKKQIALVEKLCKDTMSLVGYEPEMDGTEVSSYYIAALKCHRVIGLMQQVYQYLRYRPRYVKCYLQRKLRLSLFFTDFWNLNY